MRFLNGLFWFLLAVVGSIFTYGNWKHVEINLWSGLIADVNLPLLLLIFFLAGFIPMALWHQAAMWRMRQKLSAAERSLAAMSAAPLTPPAPPPIVPVDSPLTPPGDDRPLPMAPAAGDPIDPAQPRPAGA